MATAAQTAKSPIAKNGHSKSNGSARSIANGRDSERALLGALRSLGRGDFSVRLTGNNVSAEVAEAFNDVASFSGRLVRELQRISQVVGRDGRLAQRVTLSGSQGDWAT